ncbi:lactate utilization protein [Lachnospiraceae bacterium LCP25S3_G4]
MLDMVKKRNDMLGEKVVQSLESRNMEAYYVNTKEEARKKALELIKEGSSISWGGTSSAQEIGLLDALNAGNYQTYDREKATTPIERDQITRDGFFSDYFITSSNAITEDGILTNLDGKANRVAAIAYGPKYVVMIAGMNKVVKTEADAVARTRNFAAPVNAQRFPLSTPCKKTGACANCKSPDTICCQMLITRFSKEPKRIKVILVGEELGY